MIQICFIMLSVGKGYCCLILSETGRKFWGRVRCWVNRGLHQTDKCFEFRHKLEGVFFLHFFFFIQQKKFCWSVEFWLYVLIPKNINDRGSFCFSNMNCARDLKSRHKSFSGNKFFLYLTLILKKVLLCNPLKMQDFVSS